MDEKKKEFNYLDDEEISLKQIFEILRKRAWIIVAITLTAIFITTIINFFLIKPVYESNTTIMVGKPRNRIVDENNPITYQEIQTNRLLVSTYREIAKSRTVLEEVIKDLNLDISIGQLREKVDVSLVKDTEIIQIKVRPRPGNSSKPCEYHSFSLFQASNKNNERRKCPGLRQKPFSAWPL